MLEGVELVHREGVHVRTEPDRPVPVPALERPHHPGAPEAAPDRDAPLRQALGDHLRGPVLLVGELGVAVEIAADLGQLVVAGDDVVDEVHEKAPGLAARSDSFSFDRLPCMQAHDASDKEFR